MTEAPYGWDLAPAAPPEPGTYVLQPMATWLEIADVATAPVPVAPPPDEIAHRDTFSLACCDAPFHVIELEWFGPPAGIAGWEVEVAADETFTECLRALSPFAGLVCKTPALRRRRR